MARADIKAVGGLHANGFAFVPQDRAVPPFPQHGVGRVVAVGFAWRMLAAICSQQERALMYALKDSRLSPQ
jgi:hypothetical protein